LIGLPLSVVTAKWSILGSSASSLPVAGYNRKVLNRKQTTDYRLGVQTTQSNEIYTYKYNGSDDASNGWKLHLEKGAKRVKENDN